METRSITAEEYIASTLGDLTIVPGAKQGAQEMTNANFNVQELNTDAASIRKPVTTLDLLLHHGTQYPETTAKLSPLSMADLAPAPGISATTTPEVPQTKSNSSTNTLSPIHIEMPALGFATTSIDSNRNTFEHQGKRKRLIQTIGAVTAGAIAMFSVGLFDSGRFSSDELPKRNPVSAEPAQETTEPTATTAITEPTTTVETPSQPAYFEANPGDIIGVLKIPAICEEIQVIEYSEQEILDGKFENGTSTLDKIEVPDPSTETCERVEAYDRANPEFISRAERTRDRLISEENPRGQVEYWQPLAGHQQNPFGVPNSVYPGQEGNAVIESHGSTFSAGFANLPVLVPGDIAIFESVTGESFIFRMVETEVLPPVFDQIRTYSNEENPATLTLYLCANENGDTGSDARRLTVRWVYDPTLSQQT